MRAFMLAGSVLALAACGEQAPAAAPEVAATPEPAAVEPAASAEVTDANAMTVEQISQSLVGNFRSTDDPKSTLAITADGKWSAVYEGETAIVSDWKVFTGDQPPAGAEGAFTPASRYLEVKDADGVFYYELGRIADSGFDMFYTARGNMLSYERVK